NTCKSKAQTVRVAFDRVEAPRALRPLRRRRANPRRKFMRRLILLAAVALVAISAGSALAKTVTVTITKNGPVPAAATIAQGDTVQFTNSDTVAHQIAFKSTAGVTCTANPLVVQPAASGSCTFATAGTYTYDDPNVK